MRTQLLLATAALAVGYALSGCANPFADDQAAHSESQPNISTSDAQVPAETEKHADDGPEADTNAPTKPAAQTGSLAIPQDWLTSTAEEWPSSGGFGKYDAMSTQDDECMLVDEPPSFLDYEANFSRAAWGGYGESPDNPDAYRHICVLHSPDNYAGTISLIQGSSPEEARDAVDSFLNQPDIPEQDNEVTTLNLNGIEVHALQRWYPTNPSPHGAYQAMFHDEAGEAVIHLEINSLYDDDFHHYSQEQIAEDLVGLLRANA